MVTLLMLDSTPDLFSIDLLAYAVGTRRRNVVDVSVQ